MSDAPSSRDGIEHLLAQALADVQAGEHAVAIEDLVTSLSDALDSLTLAAGAGSATADRVLVEVVQELEGLFGLE